MLVYNYPVAHSERKMKLAHSVNESLYMTVVYFYPSTLKGKVEHLIVEQMFHFYKNILPLF